MYYRVIYEFEIKDKKYLAGEFVDHLPKKKLDALVKKGMVVKRKVKNVKNS